MAPPPRQAQGRLLIRRNSIGAPLSTMKATVTPGDGLFGSMMTSFPADRGGEIIDFERYVGHALHELWNR